MNRAEDHLESISRIRDIMERSTTFVSLTGLSGVLAGVYGLATFLVVASRLSTVVLDRATLDRAALDRELLYFLIVVPLVALIATLLTATVLTLRKARKKGLVVWDRASQRFALHLFLPLTAGGIFTLALIAQGQYQLVCAALLMFFGLALLNTSRFVKLDTFWLGTAEIVLGLVAAFQYEYGLILWGIGFGVATLVYGALMYFKYER